MIEPVPVWSDEALSGIRKDLVMSHPEKNGALSMGNRIQWAICEESYTTRRNNIYNIFFFFLLELPTKKPIRGNRSLWGIAEAGWGEPIRLASNYSLSW